MSRMEKPGQWVIELPSMDDTEEQLEILTAIKTIITEYSKTLTKSGEKMPQHAYQAIARLNSMMLYGGISVGRKLLKEELGEH